MYDFRTIVMAEIQLLLQSVKETAVSMSSGHVPENRGRAKVTGKERDRMRAVVHRWLLEFLYVYSKA